MPYEKPQVDLGTENNILRQHQRVLMNLARDASDPGDLQTFLDDVVRRVADALEIDHVKLLRYRPESDDLFTEAGVGWAPGVVKAASFPTDMASPPGRAFQTGQPVVLRDLGEADDYRVSPVLREHNIVSLLNVPIMVDNAVWGVLEADSSIRRGFSEDTGAFMSCAAALVSLVIRRTEAEDGHARAAVVAAEEARRRELLLREMQHRVKNNFQTIMAMISLRKPKFPLEQGRQLMSQIEDGIMAMALAHAQLAPTQTGEQVGLAPYLRALVKNLGQSLENISFSLDLHDVDVSIEQAVPLGLIVNELVTNAVKHAFGADGGIIRIHLQSGSGQGRAALTVSDNGKGVADNTTDGSGRKLIRALTDQVRGSLSEQSSHEGTTVRVSFYPRTPPLAA